jgi:AcrR family transcriptional regulator
MPLTTAAMNSNPTTSCQVSIGCATFLAIFDTQSVSYGSHGGERTRLLTTSRAGRGRPRRADTDSRILAATLELVREHGPSAVNVATVAARSGVARTTIYRRYDDRGALLRAALATATQRGAPEAELPLREKLLWLLARTEEVLVSGIGLGGVAAVLAGSDPEFGGALRDALAAGLHPVRDQVAADIAGGVVSGTVEAGDVVDLVLGAYLAEVLLHGTPSEPWRERTADLLESALAPR